MSGQATCVVLLIVAHAAVEGFVLPGGWIVPLPSSVLASHLGRPPLRPYSYAQSALGKSDAKMAGEGDGGDEWFNPGAVAKLARTAPTTSKRKPTPLSPEPALLEGVLEWGYYAGMSWEGRGKGTQVGGINNQDSIIASSLESSILFGVFDGHGEYGGEASTYMTQTLPTNILEVETQIEAAGMDAKGAQPPFQEAYAKTHQQLLSQTQEKGGFDTFLSGSTCITILVAGSAGKRRVVVANAGDCRALVATEGWGGKTVTSQLSIDQTPDRPDERKRIEQLGGVVGMVNPNANPMAVVSPEETVKLGVDLGPVRVFWPDGSFEAPYESCFPGLAMSRSLGDSCLDDIGVFPIPEVTVRALKPKDRFMVVASDGVWQVMSNEQVAQTVIAAKGDATAACRAIYERSAHAWATERGADGRGYRDDISVFVIYFETE